MSLVEILLAVSVFALFVTALIGSYLYGEESTALSGNRARATMLAEEAMEAVRNMRDASSTSVVDGTYGLSSVSGQWVFSGASDTTGMFTRSIKIAAVDSKRKSVVSTVTWQQNPQRTGTVVLNSYLSRWIDSNGCAGSMARRLAVSTSTAQINPLNNTQVIGLSIDNCGAGNIILDRLNVSWSGGPAGNKIQRVVINGLTVWSGSQNSGTVVNIANFTLDPNVNGYPMELHFSKSMVGTTMSIMFRMTDTSSRTMVGIIPI